MALVRAWDGGVYGMSELCAHFGVSRKTGYKWVSRYLEGGVEGLRDRSRAPHQCPHRTPEEVAAAIVAMRRAHPRWGPKKIVEVLSCRQPGLESPAVSTAGAILQRAGLVYGRRRRRRYGHPWRAVVRSSRANEVWTVDFKGQFRLGDASLCYPLTVQDQWSRYVLACRGMVSPRLQEVRAAMERLFRDVGLPEAIQTDNGEPFASAGLSGLTRLNVWWMRLGIRHQRIRRGHPGQNGAHERMHRELKAETTRPPSASLASQQRRFDGFLGSYNQERPHEGIGQRVPASLWAASPRRYPRRLPHPDYPGHFEVRRVRTSGEIKFHGRRLFLSEPLIGEFVGLEPIDDGLWSIVFCTTLLARFAERTWRIFG